jgi:AcrR family transcriptional regulator
MDSVERPTAAASGSRPQPAGRKRADTKRDKIVRSAAKLFLEKGYDNVSINDIIDVVGGSKGTIYSNFGSKEKLFEAVVEQMCSDVTIRIDTRPVGTLDEQLTRIAHSFVSKVLSLQILYFHRLMTSIGRTFPAAGRLFYDTGPRKVYQMVADWIALHQKAGNIRSDEDPHRLAVLFHDMLIGEHQLSWLTSASSEKDRAKRIDQTVRLAVTVFLQGCAQPGTLTPSGKRNRSGGRAKNDRA